MSDLQNAIDAKVLELATVKMLEQRRDAWQMLQALIKSRPAKEVRRMEREKGLAR